MENERIKILVKEFSKEELAEMMIAFEERMIRAENGLERLQAEVNSGNRDGESLAMEIFKVHLYSVYGKKYEEVK